MFRRTHHSLARPRPTMMLAMVATVLSAACATFPRAPDEGGSAWTLVETPHFAIATDMEKAPAKDLARMLEDSWTAMEHALESLSGGALENSAGGEPVLVIALKSDREREAVERPFAGKFFAGTLLPPAMTIGNIDTRQNVEILQHELAHALLWKRLPRIPNWLNEGIAFYLQSAELDRDRHTVQWGVWSEYLMRQMREYEIHRVPIDAVFDNERWKSSKAYALYIEAGLLVHMLVNRYPDDLACYMKTLATDFDSNAALGCFPNRKGWTEKLRTYEYDAPAATRRSSLEFPSTTVYVTPLGDARVHAVLAMLDYMAVATVERQFQADRFARAERHLARALELDPAEQLAILLTLTQTDPNKARRVELTKRLVDRHPDHWATWIARVGMPGITDEEQFAAFDRAWALAPWRTEVVATAAFRAFALSRWSDARTLALKAWLGGSDGQSNRALIYATTLQLGNCAEAASWLPPPKDRKPFDAVVARLRAQVISPSAPCPVSP